MTKTIKILIILLLTGLNSLQAKEKDIANWIDASATKTWHSLTLGVMGEIYTIDNSSTIERTSIGLKGEYEFAPWLSAGSGYLLMDYKQPGYMELRNRFYFQLEPILHFSKLELSLRERIQITLFPETRTNSQDTYYWRNRLEAIYKLPKRKLEPTVSIESFYFLKETSARHLDELRVSLGAYYHFSKNHTLKCYGLFADGKNLNRFILGLNYEFEL